MKRRTPIGLTAATVAAVAVTIISPVGPASGAPSNLVTNGAFASNTRGWYADGPTTMRLDTGRTGKAVLLTAQAAGSVGINDGPSTVASTQRGSTYTATAYVRRAPAPAGQAQVPVTVSLRVQEFSGATFAGRGARSVVLTTDAWKPLTVSYVAKGEAQQLGVTVTGDDVKRGRGILVDDVSLTSNAAASVPTPVVPAGWRTVYRNDFTDLRDVSRGQSNVKVNNKVSAADKGNSALQKPVLRSNTAVVDDAQATDGKALGVFTRKGTYQTAGGPAVGWTNGRMMLTGQNQSPPFRVKTRLRLTASAMTKSAVMWWPAGGGWPWEVDFAEVFGGTSTRDHWGSRKTVSQRWHADLNRDGKATEQLIHNDSVDATKFHTYELVVLPGHMWIEIDGVKTFETREAKWIPDSPGFFAVGKALTHQRNATARTEDAVVVDYVEISKPTP